MHPYYEKNKAKLRKSMDGFLSLIREELESDLGMDYPDIMEEVFDCYWKDMVEYFPYIGGDKASGTGNLTGAYVYVALGVVCTKRGMELERWGYLTTLSYQRYFDKFPAFAKKLMGKMFTTPWIVTKALKKKDEKNAANARENPGSFETKVQPPTEDYPVIYHNLVCPLANFAKERGYMEYLPYLCNLDYVMFGSMGVPLYREKTCASGDEYCDFKLKKGAPVVPAWPCHSLDPDDPLK